MLSTTLDVNNSYQLTPYKLVRLIFFLTLENDVMTKSKRSVTLMSLIVILK